jgi:hypothetical protein
MAWHGGRKAKNNLPTALINGSDDLWCSILSRIHIFANQQ